MAPQSRLNALQQYRLFSFCIALFQLYSDLSLEDVEEILSGQDFDEIRWILEKNVIGKPEKRELLSIEQRRNIVRVLQHISEGNEDQALIFVASVVDKNEEIRNLFTDARRHLLKKIDWRTRSDVPESISESSIQVETCLKVITDAILDKNYNELSLPRQIVTVRESDPSPSLDDSLVADINTSTAQSVTTRYLQADVPERAKFGERFTLLVRIALAKIEERSSPLRPFNIPAEGLDVKITVTGSAFAVVSGSTQVVHVPADADSDPLLFELEARKPGVQKLEILAFNDGAYLGSHFIQITVDRSQTGPSVSQSSMIHARKADDGETTLVVKYDLEKKRYEYTFYGNLIGFKSELLSGSLTRPREDLVKDFVKTLNAIARGDVSLSPLGAKLELKGRGIKLWNEIIPTELQRNFWESRENIKQLRILCNQDPIPWEVLYPNWEDMYPNDSAMDKGFLAEQFPVTRWRSGPPPAPNLRVSRPLFVLPDKSPERAQSEVINLKHKLKGGRIVEQLDELLVELQAPQFNVLHFACHNTFVEESPSSSHINMNGSPFAPDMLVGIGKTLRTPSPLVFMNACRTAGSAPTYTQLSGWADNFLDAGAAAFIGSLWAIRDSSAQKFAESVYDALNSKTTLGDSVLRARKAIQEETGDPTWLAYALYGNPNATVVTGE